MRAVRSGALALLVVVLLASCSLIPSARSEAPAPLYVDSSQKARDRMEQIVEAVNDHDATALKAMFSSRALEQASDLDAGVDYLLSLFPDGGLTPNWFNGPAAERQYKDGQLTEVLLVEYNVSAGGHDYSLFFADFTVNQVIDPENVGLYALGVAPWADDHHSWIVEAPSDEPFFAWMESIHADARDENGYPGVYVPREG